MPIEFLTGVSIPFSVLRVVLPVIYVGHIQFLRTYHDGFATRSSYNERVSRNHSDTGVYFKSRQKKTGSQNGK